MPRSPLLHCLITCLRQADSGHNPLEIVIPIVFDVDPAAFLAVMDRHVRAQMLLQAILQIDNRGGVSAGLGLFRRERPIPS